RLARHDARSARGPAVARHAGRAGPPQSRSGRRGGARDRALEARAEGAPERRACGPPRHVAHGRGQRGRRLDGARARARRLAHDHQGCLSKLSPFGGPARRTTRIQTKEETMQYALLIYASEGVRDGLSEEQSTAITDEYEAIYETPAVLGGLRLLPTASATTVRVHDGDTLLTDGPFIDAKEHLGGFY